MSEGGGLIESSCLDRWLNNHQLLAPPPLLSPSQLCCLSGHTAHHLSRSARVSSPWGPLLKARMSTCFGKSTISPTVFNRSCKDLCKVDRHSCTPGDTTRALSLVLLQDPEKSHRHELDVLSFRKLRKTLWRSDSQFSKCKLLGKFLF